METVLKRIDRLEALEALKDLNSGFCYYLDHGDLNSLIDLFCEDAVYSHGPRISHGRSQISRLFHERHSKGRTSRHLQTSLRLQLEGDGTARGTSVCLTFAADDPPPISPARPYLVADFTDLYRLCEDGRWRIQKRHIDRIFTAPENSAPIGCAALDPDHRRTLP